jgi:hypothetical protein
MTCGELSTIHGIRLNSRTDCSKQIFASPTKTSITKVTSSTQTVLIAARGPRTITCSMQIFCMRLATTITVAATSSSQVTLTQKTDICVVVINRPRLLAIVTIHQAQQALE